MAPARKIAVHLTTDHRAILRKVVRTGTQTAAARRRADLAQVRCRRAERLAGRAHRRSPGYVTDDRHARAAAIRCRGPSGY